MDHLSNIIKDYGVRILIAALLLAFVIWGIPAIATFFDGIKTAN